MKLDFIKSLYTENLQSQIDAHPEKGEVIEYIFNVLKTYNLDENCMVATALFVLLPKENVDYEAISKQYNAEVATILNNLNGVGFNHISTNAEEFENVRNMLLVMAKDVKVLIILLAFNLYKVENLHTLQPEERRAFVTSVRDIYAPLSARLSLTEIKNKMEDACFKFFDPAMYEQLSKDEVLNKEERQQQVDYVIKKIKSALDEMGLNAKVYGREKHLASVYNKLKTKHLTLGQIYDLMAVRVIVQTVEECYSVLGKINSIFTILPNRFKDYIATPKPNGYKSIHTCILAENNRPVEVQIRTQTMHEFNEYGVAAHWIYKDRGHKTSQIDKSINWLKQIIDDNKDLSSQAFNDAIKGDMFNSEIYAQTPNGKIIKFPVGANCIDFAYAVHSSIGNRCVGAKINGKFVPLTTQLKNGDVCEILLGAENKGPSRDWLKIVKTNSAKQSIRSYFKKELVEENIRNGKSMLETNAKAMQVSVQTLLASDNLDALLAKYLLSNVDELYALIGAGTLSAESVVRRLSPKVEKARQDKFNQAHSNGSANVLVDNLRGMIARYAKCCYPIPNDEIVGFVSFGKGVVVHRADCRNVKSLDKNRFIPVSWDNQKQAQYMAKIKMIGRDILVSSVVNSIDKMGVNIGSIEINPTNTDECVITVTIKSEDELRKIINKIQETPGVLAVNRV